jgi:ribosomal protein S18 acetylase RimI-like enzyme
VTRWRRLGRFRIPARRLRVTLPLELRPATAADVDALEWYGSQTWRRATLQRIYAHQQQGQAVFLVAVTKLPGTAGYPVAQLAIDVRVERDRNVAVLWSLAVIAHLQHLGIATRLMLEAETIARNRQLTAAELAVNKTNAGAIRLYRRLGYSVIGQRVEGYWRPAGEAGLPDVWEEEDCWVMLKRLD